MSRTHTLTLPRSPRLQGLADLLAPLLVPIGMVLLATTLSRWGLSIWQMDRISQGGAWAHVLLQGLRFDLVLVGMAWVLPAALTPWLARTPAWPAWRAFLRGYGLLVLGFVVFMELATPAFIDQYDSRPNYLFVEYLGHVREVGGTLLAGYWPQLLLAALLLPALAALHWRLTGPPVRPRAAIAWWLVPLLSALLLVGLGLAARGALGHRPANLASAALTSDHLVNQLPLNSAYAVLYAVYSTRKHEDGGVAYGRMDEARMLEIVHRGMGLPDSAFADPHHPTRHAQPVTAGGPPSRRPPNLVIVLEESLGAEFVGRLGGLPLTPRLDALADEGIWLAHLHATGTRSVRGIEAVLAGFPPTSSPAVVKQAKAQQDFFTLASALRGHGYASTFYYGGESHFDNMRSFFLGNGFDRVVDQSDLEDAAFVATWGASDGDVFDAAHREFSAADPERPFFGFIFTSSNHAPFEFPDTPGVAFTQPRATVENAVRYADHALGEFIARAKASPYWADTLFLIVADHNSRVYGEGLFPVERFHIPGLILGGPVQAPGVVEGVASQLDLAPTLLSMMGLPIAHPMIGRDLGDPAQRARPGRAIMQFDQLQAYREDDRIIVLQPDATARQMALVDGRWTPVDALDPTLHETALAHALYTRQAYASRWHQ